MTHLSHCSRAEIISSPTQWRFKSQTWHTQKTLQNNWQNEMAQIFKLLHNKTSLNYPSVSLNLTRNTCAVCSFQVGGFDVQVIKTNNLSFFEPKINEKQVRFYRWIWEFQHLFLHNFRNLRFLKRQNWNSASAIMIQWLCGNFNLTLNFNFFCL